jgi:hypothetical protein
MISGPRLADRAKPYLQTKLPQPLYDVIRRLSHIRPTHLMWLKNRENIEERRRHVDDEVLAQLGDTVVRTGPFRGMRLQRDKAWGNDLAAMLIGSYEKELHDAIEAAIQREPSHVYDVGCADGYYVVGFARRLPRARVHGFDIDRIALRLTRRLAEINGVSERLELSEKCTSEDLLALPERSLVLMDCEGAELYLLSDTVVGSNPTTSFIVEFHDMFNANVSRTLRRRFAARDAYLVSGVDRTPADAPMLDAGLAVEALDEDRGGHGCWLVVT